MTSLKQQARIMQAADADARALSRLRPMHARHFAVWRPLGNHAMEAQRIDPADALTAQQAADRAAGRCNRKEVLHVVEYDEARSKTILHTYQVKQKSNPVRVASEDGTTRCEYPKYAELLSSMAMEAFAPVAKWTYERGADVVGHDFGVIEQ